MKEVAECGVNFISTSSFIQSAQVSDLSLFFDGVIYEVFYFDEVGSTSDTAKTTKGGEVPPLVVLAKKQTNGRGRSGKSWSSPEEYIHDSGGHKGASVRG